MVRPLGTPVLKRYTSSPASLTCTVMDCQAFFGVHVEHDAPVLRPVAVNGGAVPLHVGTASTQSAR